MATSKNHLGRDILGRAGPAPQTPTSPPNPEVKPPLGRPHIGATAKKYPPKKKRIKNKRTSQLHPAAGLPEVEVARPHRCPWHFYPVQSQGLFSITWVLILFLLDCKALFSLLFWDESPGFLHCPRTPNPPHTPAQLGWRASFVWYVDTDTDIKHRTCGCFCWWWGGFSTAAVCWGPRRSQGHTHI